MPSTGARSARSREWLPFTAPSNYAATNSYLDVPARKVFPGPRTRHELNVYDMERCRQKARDQKTLSAAEPAQGGDEHVGAQCTRRIASRRSFIRAPRVDTGGRTRRHRRRDGRRDGGGDVRRPLFLLLLDPRAPCVIPSSAPACSTTPDTRRPTANSCRPLTVKLLRRPLSTRLLQRPPLVDRLARVPVARPRGDDQAPPAQQLPRYSTRPVSVGCPAHRGTYNLPWFAGCSW
ncbi:hypothetical protein C8Q78DRAFT_18168 [Trametes maxima]|nr:hypothetical protein C8Q78DRAFT_18168 [Trametes maxima]